jgi:hypothetical protein
MADVDRIRELTSRALDEFESGKPVSALVRQAHRIAVLRHDYAAQAWFMLQQRDLKTPPDQGDILEVKAKLLALLGEEAGKAEYMKQALNFHASRMMIDGKNIYAVSVDQIEVTIKGLEEASADREVPPNLHSLDAGMLIKRQEKSQADAAPLLSSLRNILARVRQYTHDYLVETESELDAGREESSFFDQAYTRINKLLNVKAPEAAQQFVAAQDRLVAGDSEAISHALTSCRRMIKSLADALYPATDEEKVGLDDIPRKMSDDAYKNRLLQYVQENVGKHKSGAVLQAAIGDLGKRLSALDSLASKGVHAQPSIAEAHTCVLQTYLLAGDLLAIAEQSSPLMQSEELDPAAAT